MKWKYLAKEKDMKRENDIYICSKVEKWDALVVVVVVAQTPSPSLLFIFLRYLRH